MSQFNTSGEKSYTATAALADGIIVKNDAAGSVVVATAATDKIIGVTVGAVAAGAPVNVRLRSCAGTIKVKAGGVVAIGDWLTTNNAGKAIVTTTKYDQIIGMSLEIAADGDMIEITPSNATLALA